MLLKKCVDFAQSLAEYIWQRLGRRRASMYSQLLSISFIYLTLSTLRQTFLQCTEPCTHTTKAIIATGSKPRVTVTKCLFKWPHLRFKNERRRLAQVTMPLYYQQFKLNIFFVNIEIGILQLFVVTFLTIFGKICYK